MSNYGIIGWPLEKTYSPIIQNYLFNMNNLDSKYQSFKIENLTTESVDTLISDLNGFNITIPHKEKILNLDIDFTIDEHVQKIGSTNTVRRTDDKIELFNTDFEGFTLFLKKIGYDLNKKNILILGSGGSSKAIKYALSTHKTKTHVVSRNQTDETISYVNAKELAPEIDLVINTTPVGMSHLSSESLDLDTNQFTNLELFLNIGYGYKNSFFEKFISEFESYDGIGMLICQAVLSFNIWTNLNLQVLDIYDELYKLLESQND